MGKRNRPDRRGGGMPTRFGNPRSIEADHFQVQIGCIADAFGFSGHGFGISPAVSIALSELILNGKSTTIDISQLNYDRFKAKG